MIAAVGNQGPKSPPLYPAADPNVIGVTATDDSDKLYKGANRGTQVAVAAPGVDIMVAAPAETYRLTTGTSVAAAHVSGVIALMMGSIPSSIRPLHSKCSRAARRASAQPSATKSARGLIDPLAALKELDAPLRHAGRRRNAGSAHAFDRACRARTRADRFASSLDDTGGAHQVGAAAPRHLCSPKQ